MNLYVVRHAEAMSSDENPDRPLTDRGREQAKQVSALAGRHLSVSGIFHSGKTRARETAEILAAELGQGTQENEHLSPTAEPSELDDLLTDLDADAVFVGHLPHTERLVSYLVTGFADEDIVDLGTASMACVTQDAEGEWRVRWLVRPDIL